MLTKSGQSLCLYLQIHMGSPRHVPFRDVYTKMIYMETKGKKVFTFQSISSMGCVRMLEATGTLESPTRVVLMVSPKLALNSISCILFSRLLFRIQNRINVINTRNSSPPPTDPTITQVLEARTDFTTIEKCPCFIALHMFPGSTTSLKITVPFKSNVTQLALDPFFNRFKSENTTLIGSLLVSISSSGRFFADKFLAS